MKKQILFVMIVVFFVTAACGLPVQTRWSEDPASTPVPGAGAPVATAPPVVEDIIDPQGIPTVEIPENTGSQRAMPEGVVNIMVLGSDFRPSSGHRTDVIMLVSVNTVRQTVSVVSFPRDLYVPIPGWTTQRINTAEPHGGFEMLAATMETNFAVRPSYYVMTDLNGFRSIIDRLGGVDIYAGAQLVDRCDLPIAQNGQCIIEPGRYHMDGETALWYIRSRHTSSDLDRLRREQEVMTGLFIGMMSGGAIQNLPGLYESYKGSVKTNLTLEAITPLLPTAANVFANRDQIRRYALTVAEAQPFVTETGAQVLLPNYERIFQILDEAIFNQ